MADLDRHHLVQESDERPLQEIGIPLAEDLADKLTRGHAVLRRRGSYFPVS